MTVRRRNWGIFLALCALAIVLLWVRQARISGLFAQVGSNDLNARIAATRVLLDRDIIPGALPTQEVIIRSKIAPALAVIRDQKAVNSLIRLLSDFEDAPRRWARSALVKVGPPAIPDLCQLLINGDDNAKKGAVEALSRMGPAAVPYLRRLMTIPAARDNACLALGNIGAAPRPGSPQATAAFAPLIRAAGNEDWDLANAAIPILGDRSVVAAVEPLRAVLGNSMVRKNAVIALGGIVDARATLDLIPYISDVGLRIDAVRALGQIADPRAAPALAKTLGVRDEDYRSALVLALQRIGAPAAGVLVGQLRASDVIVRRTAAQALWGDAVPATMPALRQALADPDAQVRGAAARALGWPKNVSAIPLLLAALRDRDGVVVDSAIEALADIGPDAIPALLGLFSSGDSTLALYASRTLVTMGEPAAKSLLVALDSGQPAQQLWAAITLADMGERRAIVKMQQMYPNSQGNLRVILERGLNELGAQLPRTGSS